MKKSLLTLICISFLNIALSQIDCESEGAGAGSSFITKDNADCSLLENYKLDKSNPQYSYMYSPEYKVRLKIHVLQYSQNDPRNFTTSNIPDILQIVEWASDFYSYLDVPLLPVLNPSLEDKSARINFKCDASDIDFIVDPIGWDRYPVTESVPYSLVSVNLNSNTFDISGNFTSGSPECIKIQNSLGLDGIYKINQRTYDASCNCTHISVYQDITTAINSGQLILMDGNSLNSNPYNFNTYHSQELNVIHVYLTSFSASCEPGFGSGPSKFWCNLSSPDPTNPVTFWGNAQLLAHELGHCLGLNHTFPTPQFNDMPALDPQGWDCTNSTNLSNNIMGYNACRRYLSPLQIAFIRKNLTSDPQRLAYVEDCYNYNPNHSVIINDDVIWNNREIVGGDIIINPGNTLTIKCSVYLSPGSKVIVKAGAKLIIDGGRLTNSTGNFWKGIEVWGNSNLPQTALNQGTLILKNGATIEFAREAIQVWKENDWSKTGGIVDATNSFFVNNWRSIAYYPYHSYSTVGNEYPNKGRIVNCEFTWDNHYLSSNDIAPAISMNHVNGIVISGSDFIDNRTSMTNPHIRPSGIYTIDASYKVLGRNLGGLNASIHNEYSELGYDVCQFKNLQHGVFAMNSNSQSTITIDHCKFEDAIYGIRISSVDNALITRNKFDFTINHPIDMFGMRQLVFEKCTGYKAEGNIFNSQVLSAQVGGALIYNSGIAENQIYRNIYTNLTIGNYANGQNTNDLGGASAPSGLQFLCNNHLNGQMFDEYIYTNPSENGNGQGIRLRQGSTNYSAGNTFSANLFSNQGLANIKSDDFDNILYFTGSGANQIPSVIGGIGVQSADNNNYCPSSFTSKINLQQKSILNPTIHTELISELNSIETEKLQKAFELQNLLELGDSQYLHGLVSELDENNIQNVQTELIANSPYLSEQLLIELGEKTPSVFPNSLFKDLILANIEVAQSKSFTNYLITKPNPLPNEIISLINEAKLISSSQRGQMFDLITDLNSRRTAIIDLLIQNELNDSLEINWESYGNLITQREDIICKSQMADMHLGRGEITECNEKLDYIDIHINDFMMNEVKQEMLDYSTFKKYILTFVNSEGIIENLDSSEIQQLVFIANNFIGKSAVQARNLLCFHAGLCNDLEFDYSTINNTKSTLANVNPSKEILSNSFNTITVIPNPNNGEFKLELPLNCTVSNIQIIDAFGKQVPFEIIAKDEQFYQVKMMSNSSGIYSVKTICSNGLTFNSRVLVK